MKIIFLTKPERIPQAYMIARLMTSRGYLNTDFYIHTDPPGSADFSQYDLGISFFYPHILKSEHWNALTRRAIINCHISYLPYNRGSYPAVWSIIDDTPAGVTIHVIDEGIDTGPIVARELVLKHPNDTGETLYARLDARMLGLLAETLPKILDSPKRLHDPEFTVAQSEFPEYNNKNGTKRRKDFDKARRLSWNISTYRNIIAPLDRRIRACSFPGGYAYFEDNDGNRTYVKAIADNDSNIRR